MKLVAKYRKYKIGTMLLVVVTVFSAQYYLFRYSIHRTTDDVLNEYRIDLENYAKDHDTLEPYKSIDMRLSTLKLQAVPGVVDDIDETICDTLVFSHYENEMVVYRKIEFPIVTSESQYKVMMMLPTLEEHDLMGAVFISLSLIFILSILYSFIFDQIFIRKILNLFNQILDAMRIYKEEKRNTVELQDYGIDELDELNIILKEMMDKIDQDYSEMKDFLENTSHELQTPLSIIQLKLEALSQVDFKDEEILNNIMSIRSAASRINRFNRSLLLIAKINNNQFADTQSININSQISQFLNFYEEILSMRNIEIKYEYTEDFVAEMHPLIAEYFIQNIITNAVKHNYDGGKVIIGTSAKELRFKNSFRGKIPSGDLFDKYIHSHNLGSNGLGMAILRSICDKCGLIISYTVENNYFQLIIKKGILQK